MWLLLPGRRTGVLLAGLTLALAACGRAQTVVSPPRPHQHELLLGLSEQNANLLTAAATSLAPWRDRLLALRPRYLRVLVDWSQLQPRAGEPPHLDAPRDGCARAIGPCAPYAGLRAVFDAISTEQRAGLAVEPVLVLYGVPAWASQPARGCGAPTRALADRALPAYQTLIRALQALGRASALSLPYWAPWNEPNHEAFIAPQRAACDMSAPSLAPQRYTSLARAMRAELQPGQRLVLGELAGYVRAGPHSSSIAEFLAALPDDVLCSASVWSVHSYALDGAALHAFEGALDARGPCAARKPVWITEAAAPAPDARGSGVADACPRLVAALQAWRADRRVAAAFQYEFREDPYFRTGLADAALTRLHPAYGAWLQLGRGQPPRC
ncbi:MAG: hypothetical protein NVSMB51_18490 [Solirubrobacteraceae bacterium]